MFVLNSGYENIVRNWIKFPHLFLLVGLFFNQESSQTGIFWRFFTLFLFLNLKIATAKNGRINTDGQKKWENRHSLAKNQYICTIMAICEYCKNEFTPKSKKAKFCSPKCRTYAGRALQKSSQSELQSVTIPEPMPFDDVTLGYMDEYEILYLKKKAPMSMNQKAWDKYRVKKLEELKILITNGKAE